ncbi:MAG: dihydrofolate reductase, partial [Bacteroidota bacterium]
MKAFTFLIGAFLLLMGCNTDSSNDNSNKDTSDTAEEKFQWQTEQFADLGILRYKVNGFDKLNLQQKKLVYYLTQAGLAGRDIMYDQNYRYNIEIRKALDKIVKEYKGSRSSDDWNALLEYTKRIWFSSGIHHHYSNDKFIPGFSKNYLESLLKESGASISPEAMEAIFNPDLDNKKVNRDKSKGIVKGSAVNFYDPDITEAEVDAFYASVIDKKDLYPISYGLNSKLVRNPDGSISEKVYSANGMYGPAIKEIIKWLKLAVDVAENEPQKGALKLLIKYYETGDLKVWDYYNIAWVKATEGDVDYINGFVEVYNDPKGYRGSYETIVQINDFDASERMAVVANNAQWFEDNSPIMDAHKKKEVKGVSYKVVNVAGESGDASPSTPIGVNLPNANWIRAGHGSKSVSLGNITEAYNNASGPGMLDEFSHDAEETERAKKYGKLAGKMHTALHEVIGHASGQIEPGVGTPKETIKNYASSLEEARADLVSLYYIVDKKLIDFGLMESIEV